MNDIHKYRDQTATACVASDRSDLLDAEPDNHAPKLAMGVTHVARSLSRIGAGVSTVAWQLGMAQRDQGLRVNWTCLDDKFLAEDIPRREPPLDELVVANAAFGPRQLAWSPTLRQSTRRAIETCDLVHIHGMWSAPCHAAAREASKRGTPYVVSPHGMLDPWALRHRRWRKRLAGLLVERQFVARSSCIHALVESEYRDVRRYGGKGSVAIVPNGIDLAPFDREDHFDGALARWPRLANRRVALFLSRVHPKKGLPVLLEAWAKTVPRRSEWMLVIAGPGENGHEREVQQIVERLGISREVMLTGPVYGDDKVRLLRRADFFVLPSHSEGFSVAVLEALACRLPVLITPRCNFPDVDRASAGLTVSASVPELRGGLEALMDSQSEELVEMGRRGRMLVERKYTWRRVVGQLNAVYRWLVAGGSPPAWVALD